MKEGNEMKTSVGMDKAKIWISGNLGTKIATRLFRGLALGVLLVAGTGLYFSINQGEAGSPASREETGCYAEIDQSACTRDQLTASLGLHSSSGRANYVEDPEVEGMLFDVPQKPITGSPSSIDQRFPPGSLSEDIAGTETATLSIDQRFPPGSLSEDIAGTETATLSIDQRFPPGTLPED
jgi:hypothetical protein